MVAPSEAPVRDVRTHMNPEDLPGKPEIGPDSGSNTGRADATPVRAIPQPTRQGQVGAPEPGWPSRPARSRLWEAELAAVQAAVEGSELAAAPLSMLAAARGVFPANGQAPGKLAWLAMSLAGLLRLAGVSVGHLVAHAFATRIRASVAFTVLAVAVIASNLYGSTPS